MFKKRVSGISNWIHRCAQLKESKEERKHRHNNNEPPPLDSLNYHNFPPVSLRGLIQEEGHKFDRIKPVSLPASQHVALRLN